MSDEEDRFRISDLGAPLYEYSQVITVPELMATHQIISVHKQYLKWWQFIKKHDYEVVLKTVYDMAMWVADGKPGAPNEGEAE